MGNCLILSKILANKYAKCSLIILVYKKKLKKNLKDKQILLKSTSEIKNIHLLMLVIFIFCY